MTTRRRSLAVHPEDTSQEAWSSSGAYVPPQEPATEAKLPEKVGAAAAHAAPSPSPRSRGWRR